ncbi:hypothetical protein EON83_08555 [bacterium]|nr:MAG: hypothetical protein EON83_08555 [bacterium]
MKFSRSLVAGGLLLGALCPVVPAHSQPENPTPPTVDVQSLKVYEIALKHVAPHMMAYWLDPAHQPIPAELDLDLPQVVKPRAATPQTPPARANTPKMFALPVGVENVVAVDERKVLLIIGTEEGAKAISKTVAFLDQPLRSVEIETRIVAFSQDELKAAGLNFDYGAAPMIQETAAAQQKTLPTIGFLRGNFSKALEEHNKNASFAPIDSPRVTTTNNLPTSFTLGRTHLAPAKVSENLATIVPQSNTPLDLQSQLKFKLTPTINNDDTVTLLANIESKVQLTNRGTTDALALGKPAAIQTIMNVRDGETIALRGLSRDFISKFLTPDSANDVPGAKPDAEAELVVFFTAHIVR